MHVHDPPSAGRLLKIMVSVVIRDCALPSACGRTAPSEAIQAKFPPPPPLRRLRVSVASLANAASA
ncbi:MAG: hypothetical protein ACOZCP_16280, partial [Pseudomonadota bacterium]